MYAVVNSFPLRTPVDQAILDSMESELVAKARTFPGFKNYYFIRVSEEEAIVVVLWESKEALEEGTKQVGAPWFGEKFGPYVTAPPNRRVGEVVVTAFDS